MKTRIMRIYRAYRVTVLCVGAFSLLHSVAYAQTGGTVGEMGAKVLGFIFSLAGVAAAIGGAIVGVKMIVGSTVGSAYATSNAIMALIGVFGGLALAVAGPSIGASIVELTNTLPRAIVVPQ